MSALDLLRFAWEALKGHRLRTVLTLLGMGIGVGAVILLTALGEGARGYVTNEFMALGSNLLIVLPGKTETTGNAPIFGGTTRPLTLEDCEAIQRRAPHVRRLAPLAVGSARVGYGEKRREVTILGSTPDLLPVRHLAIGIGRFLPDVEADRGAPVAVIGRTVQSELFGSETPLGRTIRIGDWRFRVVGVMAPKGQSIGLNMDDVVIIPVSSALRLFNQRSLFRILIEVGVHAEIDAARAQVMSILKERHDNEEDVTVLTQDSVLSAFNRILGALTLALAGIAAISLSVAGIGIMNVMLVSVTERTREIGVRVAVGATEAAIQLQFLGESIMLSLVGGAAGVLFGIFGSYLVGQTLGWAIQMSVMSVVVAAMFSVAVGVFFGYYPARKASRLDPIEALRYE